MSMGVTLSTRVPQLTLALTEYEANDAEKGDYLGFAARVDCRGFAGATRFWAARTHIDAFAARLAALDRTLRGDAALICGWGDDEYFGLTLAPFGHSGRLLASVRMAAPGPREEQWHRVTTEFIVLPDGLRTFRVGIGTLLEMRAPGEVALVGDPEAGV